MAKTFTGGALISYGDTLPGVSNSSDGALFFRTNSGVNSGLYLFGFIKDTNSGVLGPQVGQGWTQVSFDPGNFVLKSGDVMTGTLEIPAFLRVTQASGAQRILIGNQDSGGINKPGIVEGVNGAVRIGQGTTWVGNGGTNASYFSVDISAGVNGLTYLGQKVWHQQNDGSGSGLDADTLDGIDSSVFRDASNAFTTGTLPTARGGTGNSGAPNVGGIIYGNSGPSMSSSAVGAATSGVGTAQVWQVLTSGAAGAPLWVNSTSLNVAFATSANSANSATTATTATNATNAANVPWTGITGLPTASQTFANSPVANFVTYARPSLFHDMGNFGVQSMTPVQFQPFSISGFSAYNTTDIGNFQTGLTVVGSGGSYGLQIAANWNFEELAPNGLRFRVNDDTGTPGQWGAWQTIWDQGNLTNLSQLTNGPGYTTLAAANAAYVFKAGDTMTGTLQLPAIGVSASIGATGTITCSSNIVSTGGFLSVNGNVVSAGANVIAQNGSVRSGNNAGSTGYVELDPGDAAHTGYLSFYSANTNRQGYIGYATTTGSTDTGTINFVMATASFSGAIVAAGNITAFSDLRLKTDLEIISRPIDRVKKLRGFTFTRTDTGERQTGLIAQDVLAVMPEAVVEQENGMLSVAYGNLAGLFVETIKEQQNQIDELRAQVERLLRLLGA